MLTLAVSFVRLPHETHHTFIICHQIKGAMIMLSELLGYGDNAATTVWFWSSLSHSSRLHACYSADSTYGAVHGSAKSGSRLGVVVWDHTTHPHLGVGAHVGVAQWSPRRHAQHQASRPRHLPPSQLTVPPPPSPPLPTTHLPPTYVQPCISFDPIL